MKQIYIYTERTHMYIYKQICKYKIKCNNTETTQMYWQTKICKNTETTQMYK